MCACVCVYDYMSMHCTTISTRLAKCMLLLVRWRLYPEEMLQLLLMLKYQAGATLKLTSPLSATINQCGAFSSDAATLQPQHSWRSSSSSSSSSTSLFMFLAIIWLNIALVSRAAGALAVHLWQWAARKAEKSRSSSSSSSLRHFAQL